MTGGDAHLRFIVFFVHFHFRNYASYVSLLTAPSLNSRSSIRNFLINNLIYLVRIQILKYLNRKKKDR